MTVLVRERLDVGPVGQLGIRHDGRRVRVDEDDLEALFADRLAGLGARVVELAGLSDDDGPGADQQDLSNIGPLRHRDLSALASPLSCLRQLGSVFAPTYSARDASA